jgi:hypothetical protein
MSSPIINLMLGLTDEPRKVALIQSLVEKTRQGKIPWVKQASALTATLPGGYQINFVMSPMMTILTQSSTWQLLTVRDRIGSELVRVSNENTISVAMGAGSALVAAASELFKLVNSGSDDDLDRAINTIKNL